MTKLQAKIDINATGPRKGLAGLAEAVVVLLRILVTVTERKRGGGEWQAGMRLPQSMTTIWRRGKRKPNMPNNNLLHFTARPPRERHVKGD